MITGVDYILYTNKSQDAFTKKIKESIPFWNNPYIVIDNEDETFNLLFTPLLSFYKAQDSPSHH